MENYAKIMRLDAQILRAAANTTVSHTIHRLA
jgi:hypothetical protein